MDPASMPSFLMKWETQKRVGGVRYKKKYVEVWFSFSHANLLAQNTKEVTCDTQCHDHTHSAISSVNKSLGGTEQINGALGDFVRVHVWENMSDMSLIYLSLWSPESKMC